jgi:hypothetical protein
MVAPSIRHRVRRGRGVKLLNSFPRPQVTAERYRELEVLVGQLAGQLPYHDIGECLIVRDLLENTLKRWALDERMAQHQVEKAIADEANSRTVVRLVTND